MAPHPHITELKDWAWDVALPLKHPKLNALGFQEPPKHCVMLVLELAAGGELFEFIGYTGPFSETLAKIHFRQLMSGEVFGALLRVERFYRWR